MPSSSRPTDWQPEIDELNLRRRLALKLGGEERVNRQHSLGKLTIRERIDALADPGSFHEIGALAGAGIYEDGEFQDFKPMPYVGGLIKVDGRRVAVGGHDFTVGGGAADSMQQERFKSVFIAELAKEYRIPLILFHEGAGANVAAAGMEGHAHLPSSFDAFGPDIRAGIEVPVIYSMSGALGGRGGRPGHGGPFRRHDRARVDVRRRAAAGEARPGGRRDEGAAGRARRARQGIGRGRQSGDRRVRRHRPDEEVPLLLPPKRLLAAARLAQQRPARSGRGGAALDRAARAHPPLQHAARGGTARRRRRLLRDQAGTRRHRAHDPRPRGWLPGRHRGQQPAHAGRRDDGRLGRQAGALHRVVRPLPHTGRLPGRRARLHAGRAGRAHGDAAPRDARFLGHADGEGAHLHRDHAQELRHGRAGHRQPQRAQLPRRLAVGGLGIDPHRGRRRRRLQAGTSPTRRTRTSGARRSRPSCSSSATPSARRRPSASRI